MASTSTSMPSAGLIHAPIYAAVALYGLVTSSLMSLVAGIKSGSSAAAMPAMAAAGLVWHAKDLLSKDQGMPALEPATSVLNWHEYPTAQQ